MTELVSLVSKIDLNEAMTYLHSDECGAINIFIGTVRNNNKGRQVLQLEFEAYDQMALAEMRKLVRAAQTKWQLNKSIMLHVTGRKEVGEPVVFIGVASAHRNEAFEACRFLIDELKCIVPIWKKELYADGSEWLNAHP